MIIDQLERAPLYFSIHQGLAQALRFLRETDLHALPTGRTEVDGDHVFALVQEFTTVPAAQGAWEAHRRYLDVHTVVEGEERIGYADVSSLRTGTYDESRDFLQVEGLPVFLQMLPGTFAVMMPQDAHMPGVATSEPHPIRKVVMKVAV